MSQSGGRLLNRRDFTKMLALGLGTASLPACATSRTATTGGSGGRRLVAGHTGITWGFSPDDAQAAVRDVGSLGYHGFESFGNWITLVAFLAGTSMTHTVPSTSDVT